MCMDMLSKYLSHKGESITSSLYSCMLSWKAKLTLPLPLKDNSKRSRTANTKATLQVGLKTLVCSEEKSFPIIVHCNKTISTAKPKPSSPPQRLPFWSSSSSAFPSTMIGDVIGTESGDCMGADVPEEVEVKAETEIPKVRIRERSERKREIPPPITLLRETGGKMPWKFEREYSDDGRLIITAERVRRREYIEARREDGRLIMRLVREEDDYCEECGYPINDEEEVEYNQEPEGSEHGFEFEEEDLAKENARCGDLRQCVTYAAAGSGLLQDSDSFWKDTGIGDPNVYLGRPGSAPLRPMTPVM